MKAQLKRADRLRARAVVIVGEDELGKGEAVVRNMAAGEQKSVAAADLATEIARLLAR